jgi:hypothetical protein
LVVVLGRGARSGSDELRAQSYELRGSGVCPRSLIVNIGCEFGDLGGSSIVENGVVGLRQVFFAILCCVDAGLRGFAQVVGVDRIWGVGGVKEGMPQGLKPRSLTGL